MPEPLLEASELRKTFRSRHGGGRVLAVDGVSFAVDAGQTLALVGESGSGKSTVGRLVLDLIEPDAGDVRLRGVSLRSMDRGRRRAYRRAVQMVFQNPLASFNPMLTVGASLRDAMRLRDDLSRRDREVFARELLERVRLDPNFVDRYPSELSGGQLQRVGIARALATDPEAIFLDEPTSALDMSIRGQILELLLDLQQQSGLALVLVTHDLRVVKAFSAEVLVMYLGQVVERGPADAILANPLHPYTRGLVSSLDVRPDRPRVRVRGEIAQLPEGYEGCRLYPRCPYRMEACRLPQRLERKRGSQSVRCWRALDIEGEPPPERPAAPADLDAPIPTQEVSR